MKRLIKILNDPKFLLRFHVCLVFVWLLLLPPTLIYWKESILWVLIMSLWANLASHWAAAQAAHAEKSEQSGLDNEDLDAKLDTVIEQNDMILDQNKKIIALLESLQNRGLTNENEMLD